MSTLKEILNRCIFDRKFLDQLKSDPDSALAEYEIADHQKEILISGDARVLDLLGEVYNEQAESRSAEAAGKDTSDAEAESGCSNSTDAAVLPHVMMQKTELAVRLVPYASRKSEQDESIGLVYATHVFPLPETGKWEDLPSPPIQDEYGMALPVLDVSIAIQPFLFQDEQDQMISFDVQANARTEPAPASSDSLASPTSEAITNAVAAVHSSEAESRMDRLLDLITELDAVESGGVGQ